MTAFSGYAVYSDSVPGFGVLYAPPAVLLGISHVFFDVHYPTDVLAGALLGFGIGQLTVTALGLLSIAVL